MKILQAFDFLSLPHGGGTVDIVYKLSKALSARGHEVTICTGDYEIDYKYLRGLGDVGLKMYHSYFNRHGIYLMPGLTKLDVRDYDLIHLHCYRSIQNIILAQKAYRYGIPYIIDAHGSAVHRSGKKRLLLNAYDILFGVDMTGRAKFVIAETDTGVAEWERLGVKRKQIRVQHPMLDTSEFYSLPTIGAFRHRHDIREKSVVLFLGRIHQSKGIDILVDATSRLRAIRQDIRLVVIGQDDGYMHTLMNNINRLPPTSQVAITILGFRDGVRKLEALVDADVLVQPSRNEAGARPSLEAIMCHTPVIVSKDTGAGKEIASFDGGLLFPNDDAEELSKAIMRIIDNPEDVRVRTEKAREYIIANLSLDTQTREYEKLYQEAVTQVQGND